MDGVGTPIIGRPRPLPGHDTPNPAYHPHTLNYEEPDIAVCSYDVSRRHTLAATDAKLSALGLTPKAARKLMTLVSGTRGESKPFFSLDKPHYERLLCDVIEGINFV